MPKSVEMTPVEASRANIVGGKRRRGRPRKPPEKDEEGVTKSPSSASPPPSKRTRGAREGKVVSYSSFGRPRRPTARCGGGPGEELASDDQRGILQCVVEEVSFISGRKPKEHTFSAYPRSSLNFDFLHIRNHPLLPADDDNEDLLEASPERTSALEPESFPCAFCCRTYAHVKAKNRHMLVEHPGKCEESGMYFKCNECPQARTRMD